MFPSNWYDNSVCKNCLYGEPITVGVFCNELQGLVPVGYVGCKAEHAFYEEAYKKENGMTLTELAGELRKIFKFKYLAYGEIFCFGGCYPVLTISNLPLNLRVKDEGGEGAPCYIHEWEAEDAVQVCFVEDLAITLDLSEYTNETGEIDYSKCIVEVKDDAYGIGSRA